MWFRFRGESVELSPLIEKWVNFDYFIVSYTCGCIPSQSQPSFSNNDSDSIFWPLNYTLNFKGDKFISEIQFILIFWNIKEPLRIDSIFLSLVAVVNWPPKNYLAVYLMDVTLNFGFRRFGIAYLIFFYLLGIQVRPISHKKLMMQFLGDW